jgi:hypothetical protein
LKPAMVLVAVRVNFRAAGALALERTWTKLRTGSGQGKSGPASGERFGGIACDRCYNGVGVEFFAMTGNVLELRDNE